MSAFVPMKGNSSKHIRGDKSNILSGFREWATAASFTGWEILSLDDVQLRFLPAKADELVHHEESCRTHQVGEEERLLYDDRRSMDQSQRVQGDEQFVGQPEEAEDVTSSRLGGEDVEDNNDNHEQYPCEP